MPKISNEDALLAIDHFEQMNDEKNPYLPLWQLIAEYVHITRADFTRELSVGSRINIDIHDSTAVLARQKMASVILGMTWPNVKIKPAGVLAGKSGEKSGVKAWFERMNEINRETINKPQGGLATALYEGVNDWVSFGNTCVTSYGAQNINDKAAVNYRAYSVKNFVIDEDYNGNTDTVGIEFNYNVRQVVQRFGKENVSAETQKKYEERKFRDSCPVLYYIGPRSEKEMERAEEGALSMPIKTCWIEKKSRHGISQGGAWEMPAHVARMHKYAGELYGRSSPMFALSDILEANSLAELSIVATEKTIDPPIVVKHDSILGNGVIDTSPRGINVMKMGTGDQPPIQPLFEGIDLVAAYNRLEYLSQAIKEHFHLDHLLDFNNEREMTLGEAHMRDRIRGQLLSPLFTRLENELYTPLLERTIAIQLRQGMFGFPDDSEMKAGYETLPQHLRPDQNIGMPGEVQEAIASGRDFYELEYLTPAARLAKAERVEGAYNMIRSTAEAAQLKPDVVDKVDLDQALEVIQEGSGAPPELIVADDEVKEIRKQRAQQMQEEREAALANQEAQTQATAAKAEAAV